MWRTVRGMVRGMSGPIRLMVFQGYRPGYGSYGALTRPLLQRGSKGPYVVEAQKALMQVLQRTFRFGADGDFGSETEQAVLEVQAQFGLKVDGIIGKDTWTLLLGQPVSVGSSGGGDGAIVPVPAIPGTSGPGAGTPQNDGDIVVDGPTAPRRTNTLMLVGAVAVAGVAAYLLMGKRK